AAQAWLRRPRVAEQPGQLCPVDGGQVDRYEMVEPVSGVARLFEERDAVAYAAGHSEVPAVQGRAIRPDAPVAEPLAQRHRLLRRRQPLLDLLAAPGDDRQAAPHLAEQRMVR